MAAELITEFIAPEGFANLDKGKKELSELVDLLNKQRTLEIEVKVKGAESLEAYLEASRELRNVTLQISSAMKAYDAATQAQVRAAKIATEQEKQKTEATKQNINTTKEQIAVNREAERQSKANETQRKKEEQQAKVLTNAYELLKIEYKTASEEAKRLAVESIKATGEISKGAQDAADKANKLGQTLLKVEQAVGQNQRNVGNYIGGNAALAASIRNLSSELPNLGISIRTFAQSLSNNIQPFVFGIQEIIRSNRELQAQGKPTVSVLKQLGQGFLSISTLVGLAVIAGLKLVEFFEKGSKSAQEAEKANKKYADSIKNIEETARSAANEENAQLQILVATTRDSTLSIDQRYKAAEKLQKLYPEILGNLSKEEILSNKVSKAIDSITESIFKRAASESATKKFAAVSEQVYNTNEKLQQQQVKLNKAQADYDSFTAALNKRLEAGGRFTDRLRAERDKYLNTLNDEKEAYSVIKEQLDVLSSQQAFYLSDAVRLGKEAARALNSIKIVPTDGRTPAIIRKELDEVNKAIETTNINTEKSNKLIAEQKRLQKELNDALGKEPKEKKKRESDSLQELYKQDLIVQQAITENEELEIGKRILALNRAFNDRKEIAKRDLALGKLTAAELSTKLLEIETENTKARNKLIDDYYSKYLKQTHDSGNALQKDIIAQNEAIHTIYRSQYNNEIEELKKKNLTKRQFNEEAAKIANKIALEEVNAQILALQQTRFFLKQLYQDTALLDVQYNKLLDIKAKLEKGEGGASKKFALGITEDDIKNAQRAIDIYSGINSIFQEINDALSAASQRRVELIDEEIDKINERADADIEAIEKTTLSEEEKERRISGIKARAGIEEQKLQQRKRAEQLKQAQFDKAATISNIIQQGALAVVSALVRDPTGILAAIVAALTATQLAIAIATPLPKFAKGTEHSPEGPAIVGEKGRELRINPDGSMMLTPDKATLTYLQEGTVIKPHHETEKILKSMPIGFPLISMPRQKEVIPEKLGEKLESIERAIYKTAPKSEKAPGYYKWWGSYLTQWTH